jgi:hypothetical protein
MRSLICEVRKPAAFFSRLTKKKRSFEHEGRYRLPLKGRPPTFLISSQVALMRLGRPEQPLSLRHDGDPGRFPASIARRALSKKRGTRNGP